MIDKTFNWWDRAMAGHPTPISEDDPRPGFYRNRRKGQQAEAVAYWFEADELRCKVNDKDIIDPLRMNELWIFASQEPVSYERYTTFRQSGRWDDMDETIEPARGGIGGNNPPEETEAEAIKRQIEAAAAGITQYEKITGDVSKSKAQSLRSRLLELAGMAKKAHKKLKDPLWEQVKEIDNTYLPLAKDAEAAALKIRKAMDDYDTAEFKKVQAAQEAADKARRDVEEAARKAAEEGKPAPVMPPPPPPPPAYEPKVTKGAYGRAASNKIVKVITEVTDWPALCAFLLINTEFKEFAIKLAQRAVDKNFTVPGIKTEEKIKNV